MNICHKGITASVLGSDDGPAVMFFKKSLYL